MARSLSSSLFGVLVLSLILLQGVLAFIDSGIYVIRAVDAEFLSFQHVYPPMDSPARLSDNGLPTRWEVKKVEGGYTIREDRDFKYRYGLIQRDNAVWVSGYEEPQTWAINNADSGLYTIGAAYGDLLVTETADKYPQVILEPATGSNAQKWEFIRIDREERSSGRLYGQSRFNRQCAM